MQNSNDRSTDLNPTADQASDPVSTPLNHETFHTNSTDSEMDKEEKRIVVKFAIDVALLGCTALPILIFYLFGSGYERGFFCNDESLIHPVHSDTVTHEMLYILGFGIPTVTIVVTELIRWKLKIDGDRQLQLLGYEIPFWAQNLYKYIGFFLFGATCCQLATDIAKYSIGRFRPHFITLCQPIMNGGTNCSDPINLHRYIEDFSCGNTEATPRQLKEMRLSFPSGHSSFSMYTMLFTALYLHCRFDWKVSKLIKHFLQFILISMAWYTALTRVSNYKHHWSDALFGSLLGLTVCLITVYGVTDLFKNRWSKPTLPSTRYEVNSSSMNESNTN